jgi:hypothetical protein
LNQTRIRKSSIAVETRSVADREAMQNSKPAAIGVDGKHGAITRTAAVDRRAVEGVA